MTSANEFEGLVLPYGAVSDTGSVFEPDSLAGCNGRFVVLHWEHSVPIGIAKLTEAPGFGVFARARLAIWTKTALQVAQLIQAGVIRALCLSTRTVRSSAARLEDGRTITLVHEAEAAELSVVLRGGFEHTQITQWGGLVLTNSEWDQRFYPGGNDVLAAEAARTLQLYADIRKQNTTWNEVEYEQWLKSMEF